MTHKFSAASATGLVIVWGCLLTSEARAQLINPGGRVNLRSQTYVSPGTAAAQQIHAEADYLRGYGQMQKDLADARVRNEEARKLNGENRVQAVLNKIKIRELLEADRSKRINAQIEKRKENNQKTLDRLKNHPELTAGEIRSGRALNFLKDRLATKLVTTYQGSQNLDPSLIHALQVRQRLDRGQALIFRLDEGQPIQVDWWPPGLRVPDLKGERGRFEAARKRVFEAPNQEDFDARINDLLVAHASLENEFLLLKTHEERVSTQHNIRVYLDGKAFLNSLLGEIRRLERVGMGQHAASDLSFKGHDLSELLTHMVRNGLEFAPPRPGDEPAYDQMFQKLKDLYLATEAEEIESANKK